jgi:1,4-alpha-glucan branching enzyme
MMSKFYILIILLFSVSGFAQTTSINPVITPALFSPSDEITVTYDVTGNSLANLSNAWIWVWIPDQNIDAKYNVNPASNDTPLTDNAKFTKTTANNQTTFTITFTPKDFFSGDISQQQKLGMLLKGNDWSNGQTTDYIANLSQADQFSALLIQPEFDPVFKNTNEALNIEALASDNADYSLSINNVVVDEKTNTTEYSYSHIVTETEGLVPCSLLITNTSTQEDTIISFSYIIRSATSELARPAGIKSGINYHEGDDTRATLCLLAPMKSSVFVLGEFNDFSISPDYQMYKDDEYFWLEISDLIPGQEYAFQYLVDENVYVADPYAEKILDPDDQYIPSSIYPDLKSYPAEALRSNWYFNRLSIIQTGQPDFTWNHDNYVRPVKDNLIIYELLIRDFFGANDRSYNNLIDTMSYFRNLGINAIELMPIQEFNGNSSWGYNPTFMFAPDKAYGTKEKLKEFIDEAHANGIAVILDVVFNHQDIPNPYAAMYFDFTPGVFKPRADNPWFNIDATHPFSVFYDMNHESDYTKHYMDTTLYHWINEYHVDGFRFDLSKGFTQKFSGSDVNGWSQKDQSRIDLLTRMADKVWSYAPDTWLMLEHFANNTEEQVLADYGMMLWGNMHGSYKEAILGYHESNKSDLSWGYAPERNWQDLNLITYMESHDEERQMYEASLYGNSADGYDIKDPTTSLNRIKAASAFLYLVPGPKMLWQFGELGYDISIEEMEEQAKNQCSGISTTTRTEGSCMILRRNYCIFAIKTLLSTRANLFGLPKGK